MARKSLHPAVLALGAMACVATAAPVRAEAPTMVKGVCFSTNETREEIKVHHLLEPFVALKMRRVLQKSRRFRRNCAG